MTDNDRDQREGRSVASRGRNRRRDRDRDLRAIVIYRQPEGRHRLGRRRSAGRLLPVLCRARDHRLPASSISVNAVTRASAAELFAEWGQLRQVLSVVVPTAIYVALIPWIGIYVSSIAADRVLHAVARPLRLAAGARRSRSACRSSTFVVFEKWFLVPLPKGPIEDLLGF